MGSRVYSYRSLRNFTITPPPPPPDLGRGFIDTDLILRLFSRSMQGWARGQIIRTTVFDVLSRRAYIRPVYGQPIDGESDYLLW